MIPSNLPPWPGLDVLADPPAPHLPRHVPKRDSKAPATAEKATTEGKGKKSVEEKANKMKQAGIKKRRRMGGAATRNIIITRPEAGFGEATENMQEGSAEAVVVDDSPAGH